MSLSGTAYWDAARQNSSISENWLVKLYYGAEGSTDFIGISDRDITVSSVFYHGLITEFGDITEKIDLLKSKATVGNIDITCVNQWKGFHLSKEIWPTNASGAYHINRKVEIYSRFGDTTTLTDCKLIYEGRLFNVSQDKTITTLHIEQKKPQDFIKIPQDKSDDGRVFFPVVYGDYTASGNSTTTPTLVTNKSLHPMPVHSIQGSDLYCIDGINQTHNWHYYDENIDSFHEVEGGAGSTTAFQGGYVTTQPAICQRGFITNITALGTTLQWTSDANMVDGDITTDATDSANTSIPNLTTTTSATETVSTPNIEGVFSSLEFRVYYNIDVTTASTDVLTKLRADSTHNWHSASGTFTQPDGYSSWVDFTSDYVGASTDSGGSPTVAETYPTLSVSFSGINIDIVNAENWVATVGVSQIQARITAQFDPDGSVNGSAGDKEPDGFVTNINKIKFLYSSTDGYTNDFNTSIRSGSTAIYCHEIFRDMLYRFAGFDVSDANMTNYFDLQTFRRALGSTWDARLWLLEETDLQSILNQLQFEGGFIFKYHPGGGKFFYVSDTYHSADVTHTILKTDYDELTTKLTDFSQVITDTTWRYTKHPASGEFINTRTYTNSTNRTNLWPSIATEENKAFYNLEYLIDDPYLSGTDNSPNDCIALYYDNIWGEPKNIVKCNLLNRARFDLEIGDIVLFDESYVNLGKTTTVYYMIVETRRNQDSLQITCREVYDV